MYSEQPGTTYSITALVGGVNRLEPGVPSAGVTTLATPGYYLFSVVDDQSKADIRIAVTKLDPSTGEPSESAQDLVFYVLSCRSNACTVEDEHPGPSHYSLAQGVSGTVGELVIPKTSPAYCDSTDGRCQYFISVVPACSSSECSGRFTIEADVQSGGAQTSPVSFDRTDHRVAQLPGSVQNGQSSLFEFYLQHEASSGAPGAVRMDIQACAGGYPALYVCDPAATGTHCSDPFAPSKTQHTSSVNLDPSAGGSNPVVGVGTLALGASTANALYAAVAAPANAGSEFQLSASVGSAYYLQRPSNAAVTVVSDGAVTLTVSWNGAQVAKQDKSGEMPAKNVKYTVYAVPTQQGYSGSIPTTGCGLASYVPPQDGDVQQSGDVVVLEVEKRDALQVQVGGLSGDT